MRVWDRPIPRVLHRPNLFLGCEREWIQLLLGFAGIIAFTGLNWVAFGVSMAAWWIGHPILLMVAKADPEGIKIYLRSLRYRRRYAFHARPYRRG